MSGVVRVGVAMTGGKYRNSSSITAPSYLRLEALLMMISESSAKEARISLVRKCELGLIFQHEENGLNWRLSKYLR
jgi:hypothetical protein